MRRLAPWFGGITALIVLSTSARADFTYDVRLFDPTRDSFPAPRPAGNFDANGILFQGGTHYASAWLLPGSEVGFATDVNASGDVTGSDYYPIPDRDAGFLFSGGVLREIGIDRPKSINDLGQVVGFSLGALDSKGPMLYDHGAVIALNTTFDTTKFGPLHDAERINDAGQILLDSGTYVLDPIHDRLASAVPEPSTLVLAGIGVAGLLAVAWSRNRS